MHNNNDRSRTILPIAIKTKARFEITRAILHNFDKRLFILCLQDRLYFN